MKIYRVRQVSWDGGKVNCKAESLGYFVYMSQALKTISFAIENSKEKYLYFVTEEDFRIDELHLDTNE